MHSIYKSRGKSQPGCNFTIFSMLRRAKGGSWIIVKIKGNYFSHTKSLAHLSVQWIKQFRVNKCSDFWGWCCMDANISFFQLSARVTLDFTIFHILKKKMRERKFPLESGRDVMVTWESSSLLLSQFFQCWFFLYYFRHEEWEPGAVYDERLQVVCFEQKEVLITFCLPSSSVTSVDFFLFFSTAASSDVYRTDEEVKVHLFAVREEETTTLMEILLQDFFSEFSFFPPCSAE